MTEPQEASEIWFERIGPTFGWLGSYNPITAKGLYVLLAYFLSLLLLWVLPISLLAEFDLLPGGVALALAIPVVCGGLLSLMRTAHRHSAPRR